MSLVDDCETVLRLLEEAGKRGMALREIEQSAGWTPEHVNDVLCALTVTAPKRQVESFKERGPKGRKTVYRIRGL